jgi:SNF2 family DNA or RNA helicase
MNFSEIYETDPFKHQENALEEGWDKTNFAYFMEMGTGKTKVAIDNVSSLYHQKKIKQAVVVAPNSVYLNWFDEVRLHSKYSADIFVWKKSKIKLFNKYKYNNLLYILMNVEALSHASGVKFLGEWLKKHGDTTMFILDESTTIKNKSALRTKAICKLGKWAKYRRLLTGSPITKSPLDLYTQCEFLSKDLLGFSSFYTYRNHYAVMHPIQVQNRTIQIPVKYINLEELEHKIKSFSFRVTKDECLDLPEKLYIERKIELSGEQKRVYEKLRREARVIINDDKVSFDNKLTEIIKLQQVVSGFVKTDKGEITVFENDAKLKDLTQLLEEVEGKCIIWATYVHNIKAIKQMIGEKYGKETVATLYGEDDIDSRKRTVDDFQNSDRLRFLVGNPTVGGYGLTLTAARTVIYYNNSYNMEVRYQSEDRCHRIGQARNVTYIDLLGLHTIDELIKSSLHRKISISHQIMGDKLKKYFNDPMP